MNKLLRLIPFLALAGAILACDMLSAPAAPTVDVSTIVAATLQALTPPGAAVLPTQTVPPGIPASFGNTSFVIPVGLATGAASETVPAVNDQGGAPWEVAPAYTRITLQAYPLQGRFWQAQIMVYPADAYSSASQGAANSILRVRAVISLPTPPLTNDVLPRLPFANADQIIGAQPVLLAFKNGSGVRVLAEYAQYSAPINNHDLFYHFQGLTSDLKYYIVATLPVNAGFLAAQSDPAASIPPDGVPFPGTGVTDPAVYASYYQTMTSRLSATTPESFQPSLAALDALIQSLQVSP
jgi:hypothetical protein